MTARKTRRAWREVVAFDVFLLAVAVIASRVATVLHEVVGHELVAAAFGAKVRGFDVTLLGGGLAHYGFPGGGTALGRGCTSAGGVVLNVLSGSVALLLARRVRSLPWALFFACFGIEAVLASISYIAKGLYYGVGDAASVVHAVGGPKALPDLELGNGRLWIVFMIALPIATALAMHTYLRLQDRVLPPKSAFGRFRTTVLTVGVVAVAYLGLFRAADRFVAPQDPGALAARWEGARELAIRQQKMQAFLEKLRADRPGVADDLLVADAMEQMKRNPVTPAEVPRTIPLGLILILLEVAGATLVLLRMRMPQTSRPMPLARSQVIYAAAVAGAMLVTLFMVGQKIG